VNARAPDGHAALAAERPWAAPSVVLFGREVSVGAPGPALFLDGVAPSPRGWVRARARGGEAGAGWACATTDAFGRARRDRTLHRRTVVALPGGVAAVVDEWTGRGEREVALEARAAPGWTVARRDAEGVLLRCADSREAARLVAPGLALDVSQDPVSGAVVAVARARLRFPARVVHAWTSGEAPARVLVRAAPAREWVVEVEREGRRVVCHVPAASAP
jgi:hypothetical protein